MSRPKWDNPTLFIASGYREVDRALTRPLTGILAEPLQRADAFVPRLSEKLRAVRTGPLQTLAFSISRIDAQSSVAVFVANSGVIVGYSVLNDGRTVLVRRDGAGIPRMFVPPNGLTLVNLSSIDSEGNAVGGALAQQFSCISYTDPACRRKPFVWTLSNGFTILPQNGLEEGYDTSTVQDVSDDGRIAVGQLSNSIIGSGSPPQLGFVWTTASGMVFINDLMKDFGQSDADYYTSTNVSRDGNRVLVVGNPPLIDAQSTPDLILDLAWPMPSPTQETEFSR